MEAAKKTESIQILTFTLGGETFAFEIGRVREVLEYKGCTPIPKTPEYLRGVINLRGQVLPVIDLKTKFGLGETTRHTGACVVVAETGVDCETLLLGCLADSVQEVSDIPLDAVEPTPKNCMGMDEAFIKGLGKTTEGFTIILDADQVFSRNIPMVAP